MAAICNHCGRFQSCERTEGTKEEDFIAYAEKQFAGWHLALDGDLCPGCAS